MGEVTLYAGGSHVHQPRCHVCQPRLMAQSTGFNTSATRPSAGNTRPSAARDDPLVCALANTGASHVRQPRVLASPVQSHLAQQKTSPPRDHHRALGRGLLQGSRGGAISCERGTPVSKASGALSRASAALDGCDLDLALAGVMTLHRGTSLMRDCPPP
jgi:hypothetical protein